MAEGNDEKPNSRWIWELAFGGGVVVWALAASVTAIWWAASMDTTVSSQGDDITTIDKRIDGLDNVSLGNRITAIETQAKLFAVQQDRIERKIDRLLDRQSRPPG